MQHAVDTVVDAKERALGCVVGDGIANHSIKPDISHIDISLT